MNVQELETARRLGLKFICVVFNDHTLSLIEKHQTDAGLKPNYIHFTNPDFDLLARSFGCNYFASNDGHSFKKAYLQAERSEGVSIIEVKFP
jgi:Thiamine pyrophosphate-requiring enzymes [acetolactate synthase, pyruvate dehydrogenase (cytochrome), glyoxylate carboligase, phosphonopyruvate decarboxylase]